MDSNEKKGLKDEKKTDHHSSRQSSLHNSKDSTKNNHRDHVKDSNNKNKDAHSRNDYKESKRRTDDSRRGRTSRSHRSRSRSTSRRRRRDSRERETHKKKESRDEKRDASSRRRHSRHRRDRSRQRRTSTSSSSSSSSSSSTTSWSSDRSRSSPNRRRRPSPHSKTRDSARDRSSADRHRTEATRSKTSSEKRASSTSHHSRCEEKCKSGSESNSLKDDTKNAKNVDERHPINTANAIELKNAKTTSFPVEMNPSRELKDPYSIDLLQKRAQSNVIADNNSNALPAKELGKLTPSLLLARSIAISQKLGLISSNADQSIDQLEKKKEEISDIKIPSFYNSNAINPLVYAEQQRKRKLLWSKPSEGQNLKTSTSLVGMAIVEGQDEQRAEKFRKLMGIKTSVIKEASQSDGNSTAGTASATASINEMQKQTFDALDREYESARITTHLNRGKGLGFASYASNLLFDSNQSHT